MGFFPPLTPLLAPNPKKVDDAVEKVDDALVGDEKIRASELVRRAGWRGGDVRLAVAVMGAESGFNPKADNGICCIGLFQMNLVHAGSFGIPHNKEEARKWLMDPMNNANAAHKLWMAAGGTFARDWEVWMNGSYRRFLSPNQDPIITLDKKSLSEGVSDAAGQVVDTALGPLDEIGSALLSPDTWFRYGKGALGYVLVVMGVGGVVIIAASKSSVGRAAMKEGKKVAKVAATKGVVK